MAKTKAKSGTSKPRHKKTVKKVVRKPVIPNVGVARLVWQIFHFNERFELPDDMRTFRTSPLLFTKDPVGSGRDEETIQQQRQMRTLRTMPNWLAIKGAFHELKEIAANHWRCYRGYLLDEQCAPASEKSISQWLGVDIKETRKIIKCLAEVRLIEKVPLPEFDTTDSVQPAETNSNEAKPRSTKKSKAKKKNNTKKATKKTFPVATGTDRNPLRGKDKDKDKDKDKSGIGKKKNNKKKKKTGKSAASPPLNPNSKAKPDGQDKCGEQSNTQATGATTSPPEAKARHRSQSGPRLKQNEQISPTNPTVSDAGVVEQSSVSAASSTNQEPNGGPCSVNQNDTVGRIDSLYDPQLFACEVYQALQICGPVDTQEAHSELGCFAVAWKTAIDAGLKPTVLAKLWDKSIAHAKVLAKKPAKAFTKSRSAVWRSTFTKRLRSMQSQPRAPTSVAV